MQLLKRADNRCHLKTRNMHNLTYTQETEIRKLQSKVILYFQRVGVVEENSGPPLEVEKIIQLVLKEREDAGGGNFTSSCYSLANIKSPVW